MARGELLDWCRRQGLAAEPFEDFDDVMRIAHGLDPGFGGAGEA